MGKCIRTSCFPNLLSLSIWNRMRKYTIVIVRSLEAKPLAVGNTMFSSQRPNKDIYSPDARGCHVEVVNRGHQNREYSSENNMIQDCQPTPSLFQSSHRFIFLLSQVYAFSGIVFVKFWVAMRRRHSSRHISSALPASIKRRSKIFFGNTGFISSLVGVQCSQA